RVLLNLINSKTNDYRDAYIRLVKLIHILSLQNAIDYNEVKEQGTPAILEKSNIDTSEIVGIGIDFTSSSVVFVDEAMEPIHNKEGFQDNPHAYVKIGRAHV